MLTIAVVFAAMSGKAQMGVGTWEVYSTFSTVTDMVETPTQLYYLSSGSLHSFDKKAGESYAWKESNKLHDVNITKIKYNPIAGYLAVIYSNANIDLIYDDGEVVNMSDIKDAVMATSPIITNVAFSDGNMLVSTNFGVVLYDDTKHQVIESGIYGIAPAAIALTDKYVVIYMTSGNYQGVYVAEKAKHITSLDKFTNYGAVNLGNSYTIDDNNIIGNNGVQTRLMKFDHVNKRIDTSVIVNATNIHPSDKGYYCYDASNIYVIGEDGSLASTVALPAVAKSNVVAYWSNPDKIYAASNAGVALYGSDGTVYADRFKPISTNVINPGRLVSSQAGGVYAWYRIKTPVINPSWTSTTSVIDYAKGSNVTPLTTGTYLHGVLENGSPDDYYTIELSNGISHIKDGQVAEKVVLRRINGTSALYHTGIGRDAKGNIYALAGHGSQAAYCLWMLPKDKVETGFTDLSNWVGIADKSIWNSDQEPTFLVCKHSTAIFVSNYAFNKFCIIDTKGSARAAVDGTDMLIMSSVTDQDGKEVKWENIGFIPYCEDNNGRVWMSSNSGIIEVYNFADDIRNVKFNHIKVPRNDGTNYADYLLDGENVSCFAVDASNRKWISTTTNGVYLVSADGSEILEHFTTDNSELPSNYVYEVACDKLTNDVYFATSSGLARYSSTAAPAAPDFSEVYAYPNPVRPEYSGWIIVKNLMDNSLVKIADAAGNVFFQGRSEGGMLAWDGCDQSGNRVRTGVYYVLASNSANGGSESVVTKILVVQ